MGMPEILKWFQQRGISEGTVMEAGVYSGTRRGTGDGFEVVPDPKGDVICFPFIDGMLEVNTKYREKGKRFYQKPGGRKVFYNCNVLSDSQLRDGKAALVIVEGEADCLAVQEAGYPFVVSVPDGAPPAIKGPVDTADHDPLHDTKYGYLVEHWDDLKKIKQIVIATDADPPGQRLAEELVRRLGRPRCSYVRYPESCKDMNEVLLRHGQEGVYGLIKNAIAYPIIGVYRRSEMPPAPVVQPVSTGFRMLDDNLRLYYPAFMVVTGLAGHGKSTWTNQLVAQLALIHGWKVGLASFEMVIDPYVTRILEGTYRLHKRVSKLEEAQAFVEENFVFITPEPSMDDEQFDIDWLIDKAIAAVVRHGIRALVIDPWNEIEHYVRRGESLNEYTGRTIRALKKFAKDFDVLVIVVAHPTKSAREKPAEQIGLYDVSDSSHFANKADLGVVIARAGVNDFVTRVFVKKIRYQPDTGMPGEIQLTYDPVSKTFSQ